MNARTIAAAAALLALAGCASGPTRLERYGALSDASRDEYIKYRQFMTELQQDRYLSAASDAERQRMIAELQVEQRLERYPAHIQQAIWSQRVVAGMDKEAVLLSVGRPAAVERVPPEEANGVDEELWFFRQGADRRALLRVHLIQGVVVGTEGP